MKSSIKDAVQGKMHQAKGAIKEAAGKIGGNSSLEAEGNDEKLIGKVQEKIGRAKKVMGK